MRKSAAEEKLESKETVVLKTVIKYLISADFVKIYVPTKTGQRPLSGPRKGPLQGGLTGKPIQGPTQIMPPFYYIKILYYSIISRSFYNITISHSSIPDDILGDTVTSLSISCETYRSHSVALLLPDPVVPWPTYYCA